eukprot:CAMPEP_0203890492 /NCGR_PEP_ID=MMETSP0359-20131031/33912_1 /ASSEMBLY_ACC=CAM_ASM_000338 /TAXON_ID=268821 /ORGANISM="Scrippsiella Hangoei, Strain SHTV-5" /LENGTH=87 /DNA_ID=CAMNT_0050812125 /DNA_START=60 /DNA_END=319 /DNA_ORIENTATION=+
MAVQATIVTMPSGSGGKCFKIDGSFSLWFLFRKRRSQDKIESCPIGQLGCRAVLAPDASKAMGVSPLVFCSESEDHKTNLSHAPIFP